MSSKLNLKYDMAFKSVFGSGKKASQIALCSLLNSFLDQPVSSVQVINTELTSEYLHQKRPRMDLLVELEDGRLANIEMQIVHDKEELLYRMMYYLIRLSSRQRLKEGQPYSHLKNTYQILIADFIVSEKLTRLIEQIEMRNDKGMDLGVAGKLMQMIIVQLPKVPEIDSKEMSLAQKWGYFIKYFADEGKQAIIKEIIEEEEGIAMAEKMIEDMDQEWIEQLNKEFQQMRMEDIEREENARIEQAEKRGIQKGSKQTEQKMIKTLAQTMSIEDIAKALQRPIEEIKEILR